MNLALASPPEDRGHRTRRIVLILAGLLVLAVAALGWLIRSPYRASDTERVRYGDLVEAVYGLGTVTATHTFQLKLGVSTNLHAIHVREGEALRAGTPMLRTDEGQVFKAPFDGTVTSLPFQVGETVSPQLPILTIMNLRDRYLVVSLEQEGALRVRPGQTVRVSFESLRGQVFTGKVRTLFPGGNQFLVHIDVPELPDEIIPGMTSDVAIEVARRTHVLLVPVTAIQSGRVLVKTATRPRKAQLTLGAVDGRFAEVTGGDLHEGDEILLPRK